jgi:mannose-6-phosphate isomerase-like protein (cupin superfamily)
MSLSGSHGFDVGQVAEKLGPGGYEVVYESARAEVGVYVLAAPEPDRQEPHEWDELYVAFEGSGTLTTQGAEFPLREGGAVFVPAHAEHRFKDYERLVLLVFFDKG